MACKIYETVTNDSGGAIPLGAVVRISNDNAVSLSQADSAAHVRGTIGVTLSPAAITAQVAVLTDGKGQVLLEDGLTPVAGDTLWVSATVAGRATNVKPALDVIVGTIKDAVGYVTVTNPYVFADVDIQEGAGASVGGGPITLSGQESAEAGTDSNAEEVINEWIVDFSTIGTANVAFVATFVGRRTPGGATITVAPIVRLRVGGPIGDPTSGTVIGSATISADPEAAYRITGTIALPAGNMTPVKLDMIGGTEIFGDGPSQFFGLFRGVSIQIGV